jgi:outer membrane protein OmpA-like peptidoglycan-associated protein
MSEKRMAVHGDSAGLASSFTDLMTSLAVIFILLLVASHNNEQEKLETAREQVADTQRQLTAAEQKTATTRNAMLMTLKQALEVFAAQGVRVEADPKDPLGLLVLVPEGLLAFAVGDVKIPPAGVDFLRAFTPELAATACSDMFKEELRSIVVEGHADSSGQEETNLPLSQARAMAVVQESLRILSSVGEHATSSLSLRTCLLTFLSASGRGSSEPMLDVDGKEDKMRSRRVVFKIRVRSLEQRQLEKPLAS